jgi:hypothetical protein
VLVAKINLPELPMILEKNKKPGVCYALTADGVELPVIDITHPAFAEKASQQELAVLSEDFLHFQKFPAFFRRFFSRRSLVMRGMDAASGAFLGGMTTYLGKLGPTMLGRGYAGLIDRKVAGGIGSVSFRLRLQDMARLIADELAPVLAAKRERTIHLLNIGGGPAMDSLNALLLIQKEHPPWLNGRRISIHVLDLDGTGPSFGSRSVAVLLAEGAPLHGLEITFEHIVYDWSHVADLEKIVGGINATDVLIGSSEGGLFEYGPNEIIAENLKVIRASTPADFVLVGSILRDEPIPRLLQATSKMSVRTFTLGDFSTLIGSAGWVINRTSESNPLYQVVSLKKIPPQP